MELDINKLISEYSKMVHSICARMIRDKDLAMDAFQESWWNIIKNLGSFNGKSKISTWIYSVTVRTVLKVGRDEKQYTEKFLDNFFDREKDREIEIEFNDKIEEKLWIKEQCTKCLDGILHCLDNDERILMILRDIVGLSYDEVSKILNKNNVALRKTNSRNKKKLKNFLNDHCILFNPESRCYCKIKKAIDKNEIKIEMEKLKKSIKEIYNFFENNNMESDNIKKLIEQYCH